MRPLVVGVADLLRHPGSRRHEHREHRVEGLQVLASAVCETEPAAVDATLESVSEAIVVRGSVAATWQGQCRRCLRPVGGPLRDEVNELFERHPTEGDTYPLERDHIDLEPLVRDVLLLALPLAPLCAEDCRGICPTCGADLNEGVCGCRPPGRDPRWGALDALDLEPGA